MIPPHTRSRARMSSHRKTRIDYRTAAAAEAMRAARWRGRGTVVAAGVLLLLASLLALAGHSAAIVISALITDGSLLILWLLAAWGYGSGLRPLPGGERVGVRGETSV